MPLSSSYSSAAPLVGAATVAVALGVLLAQRALDWRVGRRIRCVGTQLPRKDDDAATAFWRLNQQPAGMLDRWYHAQLDGQKHHYVVAARLHGPVPTELELQCALTRIAMQHPRLLMLPHPTEYTLHSQLSLADAIDTAQTLVPFPLPHIARLIKPPLHRCGAAGSSEAEAQLQRAFRILVNTPVSEYGTVEQCSPAGGKTPADWRAVTIQLIHGANEREGDFVLMAHVSHQIADGMSGIVLLRHILLELAELRREAAEGQGIPSVVPIASFRPLSLSPSADDLLDFRPTLRFYLRQWRTTQMSKLRALFGRRSASSPPAATAWWHGAPTGISEASMASHDGHSAAVPYKSRCTHVVVPPATLSQLARQAKKHGCTVHALLHVATAFATAVVAGEPSVLLQCFTPFSGRRLCKDHCDVPLDPSVLAAVAPQHRVFPPTSTLLNNFVPSCSYQLRLSSSLTSPADQSFWVLAQRYLSLLRASTDEAVMSKGWWNGVGIDSRAGVAGNVSHMPLRRSCSVLVTNLGQVDRDPDLLSETFMQHAGVELRGMIFAQSVAYAHASFCNNVVSTARGGLVNVVTSPTDAISDRQAETYASVLQEILARVAEGEDISYPHMRWKQHTQESWTGPALTQ